MSIIKLNTETGSEVMCDIWKAYTNVGKNDLIILL